MIDSQSENIISIKNLTFHYNNRLIFKDLNLTVPKGKIVAIMGPSGTGKTTLLRLIGGQLTPDSGQVFIHGTDINSLKRKELYRLRQDMGMLFQSSALFTNLTVFENVAFALRAHTKLSEPLIRKLVLMKLQIVGLRGARDLMPSEISGGMARRVALARALAMDPMLMMYDEPFTGLDPISMGVIVKLIREVNQALGLTSIIVSHDVPEVVSIADYIYVLSGGELLAQGTPDELNANETPAVKQFIHGLADGVVPFHYPAQDYFEDLQDHV